MPRFTVPRSAHCNGGALPVAPPASLADLIRSGEARRLRVESGLSQRTMARGLCVSPEMLCRMERGHRIAKEPGLAARYLRVLAGFQRHEAVTLEMRGEEEGRAA